MCPGITTNTLSFKFVLGDLKYSLRGITFTPGPSRQLLLRFPLITNSGTRPGGAERGAGNNGCSYGFDIGCPGGAIINNSCGAGNIGKPADSNKLTPIVEEGAGKYPPNPEIYSVETGSPKPLANSG